MSNLPAKRTPRAPRAPRAISYAVDHSLDTDTSPDDYLAALFGRTALNAAMRLLNNVANGPLPIQPDPRTSRAPRQRIVIEIPRINIR